MSDYDMTFAKHLADGDVFDAIFGAEDDNRMMDSILKESEDVRDFNKIEDGNGQIGGGKGIGSDLGPNHDANKPTDDSSDEDIISAVGGETLKNGGQLNSGSNAGGTVKDGGMINDFLVNGEDRYAADHTSFKEALDYLLAEADEDIAAAEGIPEDPEAEVQGAGEVEDVPATGSGDMVDAFDTSDEDDDEIPDNRDVVDARLVDQDGAGAECGGAGCGASGSCREGYLGIFESDDERCNKGIEDCNGKIGGGKGIGSDLGPNHDTTNKPADDSSDEDIISAVGGEDLKDGQLNSGSDADAKPQDGGMVKDFDVAGDSKDATADSFEESMLFDDLDSFFIEETETDQGNNNNNNNAHQNEVGEENEGRAQDKLDKELEEGYLGYFEASVADLEKDDDADDSILDAVAGSDDGPASDADVNRLNADEDDDLMDSVL